MERWKSLVSECLMSWLEKKLFWSVVFSYSMQQQWTTSQSDCDVQWKVILYDHWRRPTQWLHWEAPKHFLKPNLHQKNVITTVWWSAAHLIHYSFLNPGESITSEKYAQQIDELLRKLQCLQPVLINRKGPVLLHNTDHTSHNQHYISWTNWAMKFCLVLHIHQSSRQPTTTSSIISTTFCRKNASTTSRR